MNRNEEITLLANEIMIDITNSRLPLHNILLKASRLSLLLDMPDNVKIFQDWARIAEQNQFIVETFLSNIEAAKDPSVSLSSANPNENVAGFAGLNIPRNNSERNNLRLTATKVIATLSNYRTQTYGFASGVYHKWQFGNVAESIFERKRARVEPTLNKIFPDAKERLNSIEQNLRSKNSEDWKNAVASCRALLMDIADLLNPPRNEEEKNMYINRLKGYLAARTSSTTKKKLLGTLIEELNKRVQYTVGLTQGGAHKDRPSLADAENVVLYTYLVISELLEVYDQKTNQTAKTKPKEVLSEK